MAATPRTTRSTGLPTPGGRPSLGGATAASGLPTPSRRRTSLGPSNLAASTTAADDEEADRALQEVLRTRPPSSAAAAVDGTPPAVSSRYGGLGASTASALPRTPASIRSRVPSSGTSLNASTSTIRPSLAASTSRLTPGRSVSSVHTPRRPSAIGPSTPTQPSLRSRQSLAGGASSRLMATVTTAAGDFEAAVGDAVRIKSMGMEGTVRYVGGVEGKSGVWVGVELDAGFEGRGKNDGTVDGKRYFECKPLCGVFVQNSKLSPPEVRPSSVASSTVSVRSSLASGRMTPYSLRSGASGRETPLISEDGDNAQASKSPAKTPLGRTTRATNVMQPPPVPAQGGKITAGSRAAALMNTSAKQLAAQKALRATDGHLGESPNTPTALSKSTTTTPRAPRYSGIELGASTTTPSRTPSMSKRLGRASLAGGRASVAGRATPSVELMPPPASPGKFNRTTSGADTRLEEMKKINAELLDRIADMETNAHARLGPDKETEQRMRELQIASEFASKEASTVKIQVDGLEEQVKALTAQLKASAEEQRRKDEAMRAADANLAKLKREMDMERRRGEEELERGMATKRQELRQAEEKISQLQTLADEKDALVMEVSKDARYAVEAYEIKLGDANVKRFALENTIRGLEDQVAELNRQASTAEVSKTADTAAQIDNENLKAQVAHQQRKISSLEDQIEELQAQLEKDGENAIRIIDKAKEAERRLRQDLATAKSEIAALRESVTKGKDRIAELEHALHDQASALANAQAEIESNRVDLADLENLRMAADVHARSESDRDTLLKQVAEEKARNVALETDLAKGYTELRARHTADSGRRTRMSNGPVDAEKSLRGFQHIIQDLSGENAELKSKLEVLRGEVDVLKENNTLLESAIEDKIAKEESKLELEEADSDVKAELDRIRAELQRVEREKLSLEHQHRVEIKAQNREISELESLVEAKIMHEDELEQVIERLRREMPRPASVATSHSSNGGAIICPLCDGGHDLEDCELAKSGGGGDEDEGTLLRNGGGDGDGDHVWCDNCDTSAHATADCPQADEMF